MSYIRTLILTVIFFASNMPSVYALRPAATATLPVIPSVASDFTDAPISKGTDYPSTKILLEKEYLRLQRGAFTLSAESISRLERFSRTVEATISEKAREIFKQPDIVAHNCGSTERLTHTDENLDFDIVMLLGNKEQLPLHQRQQITAEKLIMLGNQVIQKLQEVMPGYKFAAAKTVKCFNERGTQYAVLGDKNVDTFMLRITCSSQIDSLGIGASKFLLEIDMLTNREDYEQRIDVARQFKARLHTVSIETGKTEAEIIAHIRFLRHIIFTMGGMKTRSKLGIRSTIAQNMILLSGGSFEGAMEAIYTEYYDSQGRFTNFDTLKSSHSRFIRYNKSIFSWLPDEFLMKIASLAQVFHELSLENDAVIKVPLLQKEFCSMFGFAA